MDGGEGGDHCWVVKFGVDMDGCIDVCIDG